MARGSVQVEEEAVEGNNPQVEVCSMWGRNSPMSVRGRRAIGWQ